MGGHWEAWRYSQEQQIQLQIICTKEIICQVPRRPVTNLFLLGCTEDLCNIILIIIFKIWSYMVLVVTEYWYTSLDSRCSYSCVDAMTSSMGRTTISYIYSFKSSPLWSPDSAMLAPSSRALNKITRRRIHLHIYTFIWQSQQLYKLKFLVFLVYTKDMYTKLILFGWFAVQKIPWKKRKKKKRFILVEQSIAELAEEAEKGHGVSINQQDYTV